MAKQNTNREKLEAALDPRIRELIRSDDPRLDAYLIEFDAASSVVHAYLLHRAGYLKKTEFAKIRQTLRAIAQAATKQHPLSADSSHAALERSLRAKLGNLGDKLQIGRSFIDQSATAVRMLGKREVLTLRTDLQQNIELLLDLAERHAADPMPGYSHSRPGEITSIGHFFAAYAELLIGEDKALGFIFHEIDESPMGTGTAYGSTVPLDRALGAELLGFARVQNNTLAVQLSRGRMESVVLSILARIAVTLSRFSTDLITFSNPDIGFFGFTDAVASKEQLIPKKRNPEVLEIIRGMSSVMTGYLGQVLNLTAALGSGYQRDLQLTKEPFVEGVLRMRAVLDALPVVLRGLVVHADIAREAAENPQLFASDLVANLVLDKGYTLTDARDWVSQHYDKASFRATLAVCDLPNFNPGRHLKATKGIGMPGNLNLQLARTKLKTAARDLAAEQQRFAAALDSIWKLA